ncbi:Tpr-related protein family member, putative [Theileria annulata]|uniref:Tpr-related protein family member, putative n=1 Tax=Theileria annulata TaxID=5874 RepID=Q4UCD2_THEAN|nr:Tpr-related protein family member, putative [Theileria annulata]CAI75519.1 Tpr-related protein family member, putative [Theileria annulata]|eukprot:XP_954995.1 Tpr-related protein family member, putative [Theileria annulata]
MRVSLLLFLRIGLKLKLVLLKLMVAVLMLLLLRLLVMSKLLILLRMLVLLLRLLTLLMLMLLRKLVVKLSVLLVSLLRMVKVHLLLNMSILRVVLRSVLKLLLLVVLILNLLLLLMVTYLLKVLIPFYLIDKIEMVLLIATFFPPVIVALLNRGIFGDDTKAYSPKTCPDTEGGLGGWRPYTPQYCPGATGEVDNSFWHAFDILLVIKISLVAAVLWTKAYWEGEKAMDNWPAPDDNQRNCQILKVEADTASSPNTLTYSIDPNWTDSHAEGVCGFKKSVAYYAHFISPSLMVLVGMGLPLPNLTIETTVSRFVFIMELTFIVLDICKINSAGEIITTRSEVEGEA